MIGPDIRRETLDLLGNFAENLTMMPNDRESIDSCTESRVWSFLRNSFFAACDWLTDRAEAVYNCVDRSRGLHAWRKCYGSFLERAAFGSGRFHQAGERTWRRFAITSPAFADLLLSGCRAACAMCQRARRLRKRRAWLDGAILSMGLLAAISLAEGLFGDLTGAHPLFLLPIWLGTKLAGPWVGILDAFIATCLISGGEVAGRSDVAIWQPNALLRFASLSVLMLVIWKVEQRLQRAQILASVDPLTGVSNRAEIERRIAHAIKNWHAKAPPITLVVVDCDHFKEFNDTYGHAFGDHVLRTLARRLQSVTKHQGGVGRLGGDEFVVLFEGLDVHEARARMRGAARSFTSYLAGIAHPATISFGAVQVEDPQAIPERLFAAADALMYARKRQSRAELR
jgi:diguanylate cyclase (GGDEF)-like protein